MWYYSTYQFCEFLHLPIFSRSYLANSTCLCKQYPGKLCETIGKQSNLYWNTRTIIESAWANTGIYWNDITEHLNNRGVNLSIETLRIYCHAFIYSRNNLSWKRVKDFFFYQLTCAHKNVMSAVKMSSYLTSWQMKSKRTEINQKRTLICTYLSCPLVKQKKMQMSCSLDVAGLVNYVRQKKKISILGVMVLSVQFTSSPEPPQEKYCHTIHHFLLYIPHIETHIPIPLLWIMQTFIVHSSSSYRSVWPNWCRDYFAMSFVLPSNTLPCLCS